MSEYIKFIQYNKRWKDALKQLRNNAALAGASISLLYELIGYLDNNPYQVYATALLGLFFVEGYFMNKKTFKRLERH